MVSSEQNTMKKDEKTEEFLRSHYPKASSEITCEWLSSLIGQEITSFTSKKLEDGVLSDVDIIYPEYKEEGSGP